MAVIYMPKNVNPWEQMLPQMMSNMILSDMQDKYKEKQEERIAEREQKLVKLKAEQEEGLLKFKASLAAPGEPKFYDIPGIPDQRIAIIGEKAVVIKPDKATVDKLTNMPPWYDSMVKETLGPESNNPEALKKFDAYLMTPAGQKAASVYRTRYAAETATPFYQVTPTDQGPVAVNARTGVPNAPSGLTPPLSEDFKKDYTALGQAKDLVDNLSSAWSAMETKGRMSATYEAGKATLGLAPESRAYSDSRQAFLGNLSRSLAAERGVLTNQDIERISALIPKISLNPISSDTKAEAAAKWKAIYSIIAKAEQRMKQRSDMRTSPPKPIMEAPKKIGRFTVEVVE